MPIATAAPTATDTPPSRRRRLKPEARIEEILDAALLEFSARGFAATRMDDIAQRAGMSKGGLYAHFASKEQLLEMLLSQRLEPTLISESLIMPGEQKDVDTMIERFLEDIYGRLQAPDAIATVRLLVTEGARMPELITNWLMAHRQRFLERQKAIFEHCIAQGLLQPCVLTEYPELLNTPVVMLALVKMATGNHLPEELVQDMRRAHRQLLHALLKPAQCPPGEDAAGRALG
ncbi:transcriptional regulator, TetR family [Lampropedia hyalina DSM 16112]|jgi:AcrR family transcriptional regulator|uniref:Transcriptional regulator, TetR family n=1 Tax=Lampropedia hyalina DSM 16112 TaxID=1122156 RepID=A0A1M5BZC5_9BURK|nr:TetR/AcrR family transcriptional regulator [Lampropedia hyalina]SHF47781.1 transcriptional regulator, TetR family [Lampropedia hyalina DSM 16112]